ncbi:MAG: response regulator transcription factor [Acetobacteraceae bacterium]|nr:response regulator transcription factor [Acetobacteraceae bacterium]
MLVDDHAIVRAGLRNLLATLPHMEIHEAATGREALALVRSVTPHLVVLDLNLPGIGGLELLRRVMEEGAARVLVLSMHAEPLYAARALEAGAKGYLSKNASPDEVLLAMRRVMEGGRYIESEIAQELALQSVASSSPLPQLTARELEILRLLAQGRSMTEIADALAVSYKTVANTCTGIKAKLGVARTADLIRYAVEGGVSA